MIETPNAAEATNTNTEAIGADAPTVEALKAANVETVVREPDALERYADQLRHLLCSVVKQFSGQVQLRPQELEHDAVVVLAVHKSGRATLKLSNMRQVTAARLAAEADAHEATLANAQAAFDEKGREALEQKAA